MSPGQAGKERACWLEACVFRLVSSEACFFRCGQFTFNVYCYNVQPGIGIDYATGDSWADQEPVANGESKNNDSIIVNSDDGADSNMTTEKTEYIINTNTGKFHRPNCNSVTKMKAKTKKNLPAAGQN